MLQLCMTTTLTPEWLGTFVKNYLEIFNTRKGERINNRVYEGIGTEDILRDGIQTLHVGGSGEAFERTCAEMKTGELSDYYKNLKPGYPYGDGIGYDQDDFERELDTAVRDYLRNFHI